MNEQEAIDMNSTWLSRAKRALKLGEEVSNTINKLDREMGEEGWDLEEIRNAINMSNGHIEELIKDLEQVPR